MNLDQAYLKVYWGGDLVGHLRPHRGGAAVRFQYDAAWLEAGQPGISLSMPASEKVFDDSVSTAFFGNFLPEGQAQEQICRAYRLNPDDIYGFLAMHGRECAGALSIISDLDRNIEKPANDYREITRELEEILSRPIEYSGNLMVRTRATLSIAGAQNKLPVYREGDRYYVPETGSNAATSEILKPPSPDFPDLPQNEAYCLNLARRVGLPAPEAKLIRLGSGMALLTRRYDREMTGKGISRLHQEDFCQALGINKYRKYEEDGGPGFAACAKLINRPDVAQLDLSARDLLLKAAIYNYIIGNCDAHGKNFSLLYKDGKIKLAPFYDLVSTRVYPQKLFGLKERYAMAIGRSFDFADINRQSWEALGRNFGVSKPWLRILMSEVWTGIKANFVEVATLQENEHGPAPIYYKLLDIIDEGLKRLEADSAS